MDTKSLAKSKRAHSLHHKKHHPNQKAKAATTSVGPSSTEKAQGKVVNDKPRRLPAPAKLPSNWDRYEDEDDFVSESQIDGQSSQPSDILVPKSKGADYAYLLSEAKSQNSTRISSEFFPSLDDFVSDFGQGKESFFGVRGESLLSSIQNDSFFVDDKTPATYEASFLSLNLHALSQQLAKIDLPKRLYMEADLFPPDLYSQKEEENQNSNRNKLQTCNLNDHTSSSSVKPTVEPTPNPKLIPNTKSVAKPIEKQSEFKAETAEAELDMLLDSFGDVNLKEKPSASKKTTVAFDIDTTLDDLLHETSYETKSDPIASSQPMSKSQLLDDFDSWLDTI